MKRFREEVIQLATPNPPDNLKAVGRKPSGSQLADALQYTLPGFLGAVLTGRLRRSAIITATPFITNLFISTPPGDRGERYSNVRLVFAPSPPIRALK